ncbi:MAG TPA: triose-phosphate isomerase [Bacteroidia bacterium]
MARKKIVAGNWKMNKTLREAEMLVHEVLQADTNKNVTKIFFPPFPFLTKVGDILHNNSTDFYFGAQNCHHNESGAYTGDVSAAAVASVGAQYVLVGHSERRVFYKETPEQLIQKIRHCLAHNLTPVYCIGEMLPGREANKHFSIIEQQLEEVLFRFSADDAKKMVIAYEPVWAIGTGKTATPEEAGEMHSFIRNRIAHHYNEEVANSISILYGGSCNAQNAKELFATKDIDGGLIGGASLKAADFVTIINSF